MKSETIIIEGYSFEMIKHYRDILGKAVSENMIDYSEPTTNAYRRLYKVINLELPKPALVNWDINLLIVEVDNLIAFLELKKETAR